VKAKSAILVILCIAILIAGARVFDWSVLRKWRTPAARVRWRQTLAGPASSAPALGSDGSIFVTTRTGSVYSLNPSGEVQWAYRPGLDEIPNGLLLDGENNLYFSTQKRVFSLTSSGKKRWETACATAAQAWYELEPGALGDGVVYATCGENLSALNSADGHEVWHQQIFGWQTLPVVLKDGAVVSTRDWSLVAVDAQGNTMWHFPPANYVPAVKRPGLVTDNPFFSSPIAVDADETMYMGSGDGEFSAFRPDGTLKWTYDAGALRGVRFDSTPVIATDGTVIALSSQGTVYAFTQDGSVRWFFTLGDRSATVYQPAPLLANDGTIYVVSGKTLVALSSMGKKLWTLALSDLADVSPTLAPGGTLYVATGDSALYAVRTSSKGLMASAWPKYQHDAANSGHSSNSNSH